MGFNDASLPPVLPEDAAPLLATVVGSVLLPGDAGYDDERAVWNLNHELVPAMIVVPEDAADVQAAVTFAAEQHRPILVKTTGHQIVGRAYDRFARLRRLRTRGLEQVMVEMVEDQQHLDLLQRLLDRLELLHHIEAPPALLRPSSRRYPSSLARGAGARDIGVEERGS